MHAYKLLLVAVLAASILAHGLRLISTAPLSRINKTLYMSSLLDAPSKIGASMRVAAPISPKIDLQPSINLKSSHSSNSNPKLRKNTKIGLKQKGNANTNTDGVKNNNIEASKKPSRTGPYVYQNPGYRDKPLSDVRALAKKMTPANKRNLKDGVKFRFEYSNYKLLTAEEEKIAGKFSSVGHRLDKIRATLASKLSREPELEEWAAACKLSVSQLEIYSEMAKRARNRLVQHNLRLVDFWARRLIEHSVNCKDVPYFELVAEGIVGLRKAADRYDGRSRFMPYAAHYIRAELFEGVSKLRPGSFISHDSIMLHFRSRKTKYRLEAELQRDVSEEEIAAVLNRSVDRLAAAKEEVRTKSSVVSASESLTGSNSNNKGKGRNQDSDNPVTYLDLFLSPKQQNGVSTEFKLWQVEFLQALDCLTPVERRTLMYRYGLDPTGQPRSIEHTAELMAVSAERVRLILIKATDKLKASPLAAVLEEGPPVLPGNGPLGQGNSGVVY